MELSGGGAAAGDPQMVRAVFDQVPVVLAGYHGPEQRLAAVNAAYRALTARADPVGQTLRETFPELGGQQIFELFDRVYATGVAESFPQWRFQLDRGSGELDELFVELTMNPWRGDDGAVVGVIITVIDRTAAVREQQAGRRREAEAERRYQAARDVVAELQAALLPNALPVLPGVDIGARYLVAAHDQAAGGDWFDAVPLPDGRVALVVGDVVGHGVAASAAMGQLRAILAERLADPLEPADLAHVLNRLERIASRSPVLHASTVCVVIVDPETGALQYSTNGHPPPLLISAAGEPRILPGSGGAPLGTGGPIGITHDQLEPGDLVVLYTDGLVERPGKSLDTGTATLAQIAAAAAANKIMPTGAPLAAVERVCADAVELLTRTGYADDVTILAAQRRPHPFPPLHLTVDAAPGAVTDMRAAMRDWLAPVDPSLDDRTTLDLAVSELVANAIEHGSPDGPTTTVTLDAVLGHDGILQLSITDQGRWRPPGTVPPATSGRGLWLTGALLDELRIDTAGHDDHGRHADESGTGTRIVVRHRLRRLAALATERAAGGAHPVSTPYSAVLDENSAPVIVRVNGSIDATTAAEFADRLDTASRGGIHPLTVDLTAVDALTSAAVAALFRAREDHRTHRTTLNLATHPGSIVARVLDLVGLDRMPPPA